MTDVNHVITLGIGTPGDVEHFILFGLTGALIPVFENLTLHSRSSGLTVEDRDLGLELIGRSSGLTVEDR